MIFIRENDIHKGSRSIDLRALLSPVNPSLTSFTMCTEYQLSIKRQALFTTLFRWWSTTYRADSPRGPTVKVMDNRNAQEAEDERFQQSQGN